MSAADEIVDFLVGNISSEKLAGFHASEGTRRRVWELIEKEKDAGLLSEEKAELDDYLRLEHLIVLAKAKASIASADAR